MVPNEASLLIRQLQIDEHDIQRRLRYVGFGPEDSQKVQSIAPLISKAAAELTEVFFDSLKASQRPNFFWRNKGALEEARRLKTEHIQAMVKGSYGLPYVEQRLRLGMIYAQVGLDVKLFLGAFHHLMGVISFKIMENGRQDPVQAFDAFMSFKKLAFFDISLIVDVIVFERERVICLQQELIHELSTPVLQVKPGLLVLPLVGAVDTQRARLMTEELLKAVRKMRARAVVIDITGVPVVDSKVANHLAQTLAAAELMGARTFITGITTEVAESMVVLGVDVNKLRTAGDLQGGLEEAERALSPARPV